MSAADTRPLFFQTQRDVYYRVRVASLPCGRVALALQKCHLSGPYPLRLGVLGPSLRGGRWGGMGKGPVNTRNSFHTGQLEKRCFSASLGAMGHGERMFHIKTSDKVPSGCIFCIKEGALGSRRSTLTRKLLSVAPNCYRHPGKRASGDRRMVSHGAQQTDGCD